MKKLTADEKRAQIAKLTERRTRYYATVRTMKAKAARNPGFAHLHGASIKRLEDEISTLTLRIRLLEASLNA